MDFYRILYLKADLGRGNNVRHCGMLHRVACATLWHAIDCVNWDMR